MVSGFGSGGLRNKLGELLNPEPRDNVGSQDLGTAALGPQSLEFRAKLRGFRV